MLFPTSPLSQLEEHLPGLPSFLALRGASRNTGLFFFSILQLQFQLSDEEDSLG